MKPETASTLIELNRRFYREFGGAFAATRRRIQDGVRTALAMLPDEGIWLDLGCGSGALAVEWVRSGRTSRYLGLDFSPELLAEAAQEGSSAQVRFELGDLSSPDWASGLPLGGFRGVLAFAALHHLPGVEMRLGLLRQVHDLLSPGGWLVHSEWQFQHSPRLMARRLDWQTVGLAAGELEEGDTLLDWRYALPGQAEQIGLRYVHLFSRSELAGLAAQTGFTVRQEYESDGQGGRLGLYQVWTAD